MTKFLISRVRGALAAFSFVALLANPSVGSATTLTTAQSFTTFNLTLSNAFGTGSFGSVTVSDLGGGVANFAVSVAPNYLVDTGAHSVLTFSPLFSAGGAVNSVSDSHFTVSGPGSYGNPPFGNFTFKIESDCTMGASPGCKAANGQAFNFHVTNFTGLSSASGQFSNNDIFFAVDIFNTACTGDCTGAVGATLATSRDNDNPPGTPLPGAVWLFGTVLAGGAGYGRWRKKRKAQLVG
jgi:hypothetical protein